MTTTRQPAVNRAVKMNKALHPDLSWIRLLRLVFGGLAVAAVIYNVWRSATGESDHTVLQTLSHFTNVANFGIGLTMLIGAFSKRATQPAWWDDLRGMFAFMIVMTGIIYAVLVAEPGELARWDLSWTNLATHRFVPLAGLAGWLFITMTRSGRWWRPLVWLLFPIAWLAYTWIHGAIGGWYPYGFLDPSREGGWGRVIGMMGPVVGAFLAVAVVMHLLGNLRCWMAHRKRR